MYTDEAFEGFRSAIIDGDINPIQRALGNPMLAKWVTTNLLLRHKIGGKDFNELTKSLGINPYTVDEYDDDDGNDE